MVEIWIAIALACLAALLGLMFGGLLMRSIMRRRRHPSDEQFGIHGFSVEGFATKRAGDKVERAVVGSVSAVSPIPMQRERYELDGMVVERECPAGWEVSWRAPDDEVSPFVAEGRAPGGKKQ